MAKSFEELLNRFSEIEFNESFDMIVAIANGGVVPAAIINQRLDIPIELLKINLRDQYQKPRYEFPQLIAPIAFDYIGKTILLVEDRVKSGRTLEFARLLLDKAKIVKTFAVNGEADYSLYNEPCFKFPWII